MEVEPMGAEDANEEEDADEQVEIAETYQDYKPAKCENFYNLGCVYKFRIRFSVSTKSVLFYFLSSCIVEYGKPHPDPIVETSSLASVSPPKCDYKLALPDKVIHGGLLSSLQLESVVYASQLHEKFLPNGERAGFLIG